MKKFHDSLSEKDKRRYAADFKEVMPIVFDVHLPKWNYRAIPQV